MSLVNTFSFMSDKSSEGYRFATIKSLLFLKSSKFFNRILEPEKRDIMQNIDMLEVDNAMRPTRSTCWSHCVRYHNSVWLVTYMRFFQRATINRILIIEVWPSACGLHLALNVHNKGTNLVYSKEIVVKYKSNFHRKDCGIKNLQKL